MPGAGTGPAQNFLNSESLLKRPPQDRDGWMAYSDLLSIGRFGKTQEWIYRNKNSLEKKMPRIGLLSKSIVEGKGVGLYFVNPTEISLSAALKTYLKVRMLCFRQRPFRCLPFVFA